MFGALIGDIAGSRFEWRNHKSKDFELFTPECRVTDDSVMTMAVAQAILNSGSHWDRLSEEAIKAMQNLGRKYPNAGYGGSFFRWLHSDYPEPYNSWGNGAAMRVSPCAWAAESLDEALLLSDAVTGVTHNHPEGLKGARAVTTAIFMARQGEAIPAIREKLQESYYPLDFTIDGIRPAYRFDVSCQGSVPQALEAFLESTGFEDAVRTAVSVGGDSDTIGAMAGGIAGAYYGIPEKLRTRAEMYLDERQMRIVEDFEARYGTDR